MMIKRTEFPYLPIFLSSHLPSFPGAPLLCMENDGRNGGIMENWNDGKNKQKN